MIRKGFYFSPKTEKNKGDRDFNNGDYGTHIGKLEKVKNIASMTSKSIYSNLVKRIQIPSNSQSKLNSLCTISTILERKNIYRLPSFQYEI